MKRPRWFAVVRAVVIVLVAGVAALGIIAGAVWVWSFQWLRDGRRQLDSGHDRTAVKSLTAFLRWHPGNSEGHFLLGGAYGKTGKWESALHHFQQVPPDAREGKDALWRIGDVAMMLNRAADTEMALRRSIELDPASLEARRGLIALYRWQDREMDAEPLVWQAFELTADEERPFLMAEWFRFHFAQRSTSDTFRRLSGFLAAQPDDTQSAIALGLFYVRQRQLAQARVLLEKVFAHAPESVDARAAWATCLLELGESETAQQVLDEWPDQQRDLRYEKLRGIWLLDFAGDYAAALDSLQRWLERYPDDWQVRFRVSTCLRQLGRSDEAETEMARGEKLKETIRYELVDQILTVALRNLYRPEHRHRIGEFYRAVGIRREAKLWFDMALAVDPQFEPSRRALQGLEREGTN